MVVKVIAFGIAKEIFGNEFVQAELEKSATVETLKTMLLNQFPRLKDLSSFVIAVNSEYAQNSLVIAAGDEVAIIPPVSGG